MDGPAPDRRQQIIEAAFRVFSRKGFRGATNREIAAEAGVAPGLIYWYFRNKEDLFLAVAEAKSLALPLARLSETLHDAPPREFFRAVARQVATTFQSDTTRSAARFLLAEGLRHERLRDIWRQRVIGPGLAAVTRYIERQVERGHLRPVDPQRAARLFVGMIMSQVLVGLLLELDRPSGLAPILEEAVEVFLRGVTPGAPETPDASGAPQGPDAPEAPGPPESREAPGGTRGSGGTGDSDGLPHGGSQWRRQ
ncbi:MAG TPA: TetR/AcrR family transcriptional regulator [Symbiobacteriaceae bacterium]